MTTNQTPRISQPVRDMGRFITQTRDNGPVDALLRAISEEELARILTVKAETKIIKKTIQVTPNSKHAVRVVYRAQLLAALGNELLAQGKTMLDQLETEIVSELQAKGTEDLDKLFAAIDNRCQNAFAKMRESVTETLGVAAKGMEKQVRADLVTYHDLAAAPGTMELDKLPIMGATLTEHFQKLADDLVFRIKAAIRAGVDNEETVDEIVQRIEGEDTVQASEHIHAARGVRSISPLLDTSKNSLSKTMKMAISKIVSRVQEEAEPDDSDTDKEMGWEWVAVLDGQTCPQCEALDGERWTSDYEPIGDAEEYEAPPIHPKCRCVLLPVDLEDEAAKMSFDDYLAQFSRKEQETAFGKKALREYAKGERTASELIGDESNLLTLQGFLEALT